MVPARSVAIALVALGGFFGSVARYGVTVAAPGLLGTFAVNVTGSFALGCVFYTTTTSDLLSARARLLVATGFLSSYTTYSMFAFETTSVSVTWGAINVLGSYACGFGAAVLGRHLVLGRGA